MALSRYEREQLELIEETLSDTDPMLAARIAPVWRPAGRTIVMLGIAILSAVIIAGSVLLFGKTAVVLLSFVGLTAFIFRLCKKIGITNGR